MRTAASAWEAQYVAEMRQRCANAAASIGGLATIGMETEDARQMFLLAVVEACRIWAVDHEDKPSRPYIHCAIRRRKLKIWTAIGKATRRENLGGRPRHSEMAYEPVVADDGTPIADEAMIEAERRAIAHGWSALLRHRLSPSEYALLRLRSEGWSNTEIALLTGSFKPDDEVHGVIRRRYWQVKKKASDFLKSLGIDNVEEAFSASPEIRHAAWEKTIKKDAKTRK